MATSNINKLASYCLDCIKYSGRGMAFNNLKKAKIIPAMEQYRADNKAVIDIMTSYAMASDTMSLIYGCNFLTGSRAKVNYYTPLLYTEARLTRDGSIIRLEHGHDMSINVGVIAELLQADSDEVESIINDITDIGASDVKSVIKGILPDMEGLRIDNKQSIILSKYPESTAGLISELKRICKEL